METSSVEYDLLDSFLTVDEKKSIEINKRLEEINQEQRRLDSEKMKLVGELEALGEKKHQMAIREIKQLMKSHSITVDELSSSIKKTPKPKEGNKRPAKYKDPVSGKEWAGTGSQPLWVKFHIANGGSLDDFLIK